MSSWCLWCQWLYPWVMETEVRSELSPKTHCFGDTPHNDDKWEKEMGSCPKDIRWLVVGEHNICRRIRRALRRLDTFPEALVWRGRGRGEAGGAPLGSSPGPSGSAAEGSGAASGTPQRCCWCPQPVGRLVLPRVFQPLRTACYFIWDLQIKA